jgi:hypothetical protein
MSISSISNAANIPQLSSDINKSSNANNAVSKRLPRPYTQGNGLMAAVEKSFSQMGVNFSQQTFKKWQVEAGKATGGMTPVENPRKALQTLMKDLFSTLTVDNNYRKKLSTDTVGYEQGQPIRSKFTNMSAELQELAQTFGENNSSAQSGLSTKLETDFQKFISAFQGSSSSENQLLDLPTFLQNLAQNVSGQQISSVAVGTFVSTEA